MRNQTLRNVDKYKVEEAMIDMMDNNKLARTKLEKKIPIDLYSRLERMWKHALDMDNQIREGTLAKIMPKLLED